MKQFFSILCIYLALLNSAFATTRNVSAFGAVGDGVTNDTTAINNAGAALVAGDKLFFPCGSTGMYLMSTAVLSNINLNNIELYAQTGCPNGQVIVKNTSAPSGAIMSVGNSTRGSFQILTSASTIASQTVNTSWATAGIGVGDLFYIENGLTSSTTHVCGGSGCAGEVLKLCGVAGTVGTVCTMTHHSYDPTTQGTWVKKISSPVTGFYIHDITFDGNGTAGMTCLLESIANSTFGDSNSNPSFVCQNSLGYSSGAPFGNGAGLFGYDLYNDTWTNVSALKHGNSGDASNTTPTSAEFVATGNQFLENFTVAQEGAPSGTSHGTFGFSWTQSSNGILDNVKVDGFGSSNAGGAGGRLVKFNSASFNTITNFYFQRWEGNNVNGWTYEYWSEHNHANTGSIVNGIDKTGSHAAHALYFYGDVNQGANEGNNNYNTLENMTIGGNDGYGIIFSDNDSFNAILTSSITGTSGSLNDIYSANGCCSTSIGNYFSGDLLFGPSNAGFNLTGLPTSCINSNTFQTSLGSGIFIGSGSTGTVGSGNTMNGFSSNLTNGACPVAGTSGEGPLASYSSTALSFGNEVVSVTSAPLTTTLTNVGTNTLHPVTIYLESTGTTSGTNFTVSTNGCGSNVSAGGNCPISLTFTPVGLGAVSDVLDVINDSGGAMQRIALNGFGISASPPAPAPIMANGAVTIFGGLTQ